MDNESNFGPCHPDRQYSRNLNLKEPDLAWQSGGFSQMTTEMLQGLFEEFNARYFGSRLPTYTVQLVGYITKLGEAGSISRSKKLIRVSGCLSDAEIVSTLIHEMAHASVRGGHTAKWFEEMERLRREGAPLSDMDLDLLATGPSETLSRAKLESLAQEALCEEPDTTEWRIARWIVHRYDYANSPTAFFRKYWWARSVLRACRLDGQVGRWQIQSGD